LSDSANRSIISTGSSPASWYKDEAHFFFSF
jgi:hypothetical protein